MAHIKLDSGLWIPESLYDKIDTQKMLIENTNTTNEQLMSIKEKLGGNNTGLIGTINKALKWRGWCSKDMSIDDYRGDSNIGFWSISTGDSTPSNMPLGRVAYEVITLVIWGIPSSASTSGYVQELYYTTQNIVYRRYYYNSTWSAWKYVTELSSTDKQIKSLKSTTLTGNKVPKVSSDGYITESNIDISNINVQNGKGMMYPDPDYFKYDYDGWTGPDNGIMSTICCWNGIGGMYDRDVDFIIGMQSPNADEFKLNMLNIGDTRHISPYRSLKVMMPGNYPTTAPPLSLMELKGNYVRISSNFPSWLLHIELLKLFNYSIESELSGSDIVYKPYTALKISFAISLNSIGSDTSIINLDDGRIQVGYKAGKGLRLLIKNNNNSAYLHNSGKFIPVTYDPKTFHLCFMKDGSITLTDETVSDTCTMLDRTVTFSKEESYLNFSNTFRFYGVAESWSIVGEPIPYYHVIDNYYKELTLSNFLPNQGIIALLTQKWYESVAMTDTVDNLYNDLRNDIDGAKIYYQYTDIFKILKERDIGSEIPVHISDGSSQYICHAQRDGEITFNAVYYGTVKLCRIGFDGIYTATITGSMGSHASQSWTLSEWTKI